MLAGFQRSFGVAASHRVPDGIFVGIALFKQDTGTTLTDFINTQRIQRAANLLSTTEQNISVVAEQVGILDVNYFTKMFKKSMGSTPTQYRRQSRAR